MKYAYIFFILLITGFSFSSTDQAQARVATHDSLQLLTYGLQRPQMQCARNSVAAKYGFSYKTIAGCVVTKELVDSANNQNAAVRKRLEQRYGQEFWARFEKEVKEEVERQKDAIN